ncbi:hypothetical protein C0J50_15962, partial [Silurus asotus]
EAGVKASRATTHRRVKEFGYSCLIPLVKPILNQRQCQRLLTWDKEKKNWTVAQWSKVSFLDESKFCILYGNQGPRVWRKGTEKSMIDPPPTMKHGGGSIMLWGCFASACTGKLQRVQGSMNSLQYQEILDDSVMQSVTNLRLGRCWTFQQDNDPKHISKSTRAWLQIKGWNILKWPSQSPDLNPIENLWWDLKKAVAVRKPKNVTELEAFAHDEWAKIPVDRCKTLVSSYASSLKAVITVKGCCTKY